jgi:hypothetical protein
MAGMGAYKNPQRRPRQDVTTISIYPGAWPFVFAACLIGPIRFKAAGGPRPFPEAACHAEGLQCHADAE